MSKLGTACSSNPVEALSWWAMLWIRRGYLVLLIASCICFLAGLLCFTFRTQVRLFLLQPRCILEVNAVLKDHDNNLDIECPRDYFQPGCSRRLSLVFTGQIGIHSMVSERTTR